MREVAYLTRYAGNGLINTFIGLIIIFSAMAMGFSPIVSNISGYVAGFTLGFVLSKKFVFRSNGHIVPESVRYLFAFIFSFISNLLVLRLAMIYFEFHVVTSQVLAAMAYTLLMYIMTRFFVFGPTREI